MADGETADKASDFSRWLRASQAAAHAMREPDAHVTAIDVSETSLNLTRELQRLYGLRNLALHRLAIEEVASSVRFSMRLSAPASSITCRIRISAFAHCAASLRVTGRCI